jgi:hypothetical protein
MKREGHEDIATACADEALRELRIAVTTADTARWARVDPSLAPLRLKPDVGLNRRDDFDRILQGLGSPRLADLPPFADIIAKLRAVSVTTPAQLAAVAATKNDRDLLRKAAGIENELDSEALGRLAQFAELVVVIQGDTRTAMALWRMNVRSIAALPTDDGIPDLARKIATDQLGWAARIEDLLRDYLRLVESYRRSRGKGNGAVTLDASSAGWDGRLLTSPEAHS